MERPVTTWTEFSPVMVTPHSPPHDKFTEQIVGQSGPEDRLPGTGQATCASQLCHSWRGLEWPPPWCSTTTSPAPAPGNTGTSTTVTAPPVTVVTLISPHSSRRHLGNVVLTGSLLAMVSLTRPWASRPGLLATTAGQDHNGWPDLPHNLTAVLLCY